MLKITQPIRTNLKQQHSNQNWRISTLEKGGASAGEDEANNYAFFNILQSDIICIFFFSLSLYPPLVRKYTRLVPKGLHIYQEIFVDVVINSDKR